MVGWMAASVSSLYSSKFYIVVFTEMVLDDVFRLFIMYMYLFCFIIFSGPGVIEADENCMKFLKRTLPCAFEKVHCTYMYMYMYCTVHVCNHL